MAWDCARDPVGALVMDYAQLRTGYAQLFVKRSGSRLEQVPKN